MVKWVWKWSKSHVFFHQSFPGSGTSRNTLCAECIRRHRFPNTWIVRTWGIMGQVNMIFVGGLKAWIWRGRIVSTLEVDTLASEISSSGLNLGPDINCHPGALQAEWLKNVCAVPQMAVNLSILYASINWWMLRTSGCLSWRVCSYCHCWHSSDQIRNSSSNPQGALRQWHSCAPRKWCCP